MKRSIAATLALFVLFTAPAAFAQKTTKPAGDDAAGDESSPPAEATPAKPAETTGSDATATAETPGKRYYFVGARYRGTVIPKFLVNAFVNEGATFYSNTVGLELDMRKDGQSTIPWIAYANYGFGDTLFFQKNKPDDPSNYSDVSSSLGAIYLGLDELWSAPLDESHHWDFEYGFGVGIGFVFGTLTNDWVYQTNNGPLVGSNGNHYAMCQNQGDAPSCQPGAHQNSTDIKVAGFSEKNWFNGGSVPVLFPHIAFPQLGIRWKPVKQLETRLQIGFSLTGFWFGLSADYGLEKTEASQSARNAGGLPRMMSSALR